MTENRNRYPGINPHLNSALQQKSWKTFHIAHITHLSEDIAVHLPKGYFIKLVEINYFHEKRTVVDRVPSYSDHDACATRYAIINDPCQPVDGMARYGFGKLQ
jgi:hypothetical protein